MFNWFCVIEAELKGFVSTETGLDNRLSELQGEQCVLGPLETSSDCRAAGVDAQDAHSAAKLQKKTTNSKQPNTANSQQQRKHLFLFLHHLWLPHPLPNLQLVPDWSFIVQFSVTVSLISCSVWTHFLFLTSANWT